MKTLIKFIIKYFILVTLLPIIYLILFKLPIAVFIYGMLLYGIGRAVGEGMYFQTKLNKPIPELLVDTVKSAKYHTFTFVLAIGAFVQALNLYLCDVSMLMFILMIVTAFIFYYFSYARMYNYIRNRLWYNKYSLYEIMICGKIVWIKYPSKKLSLILAVIATILLILSSVI